MASDCISDIWPEVGSLEGQWEPSRSGTRHLPVLLQEQMFSMHQNQTPPQGTQWASHDSPLHQKPTHAKCGICHPLLIVWLFSFEMTAQVNIIFTPLLCWSVWANNVRVMLPDDFTRLCFHDDTSSPTFSTGLRMIWCKNSVQSIVMELSLSILPVTHNRKSVVINDLYNKLVVLLRSSLNTRKEISSDLPDFHLESIWRLMSLINDPILS